MKTSRLLLAACCLALVLPSLFISGRPALVDAARVAATGSGVTSTPQLLADLGGNFTSTATDGTYAYLDIVGKFVIVDLRHPAQLKPIGELQTEKPIWRVLVGGGIAYLDTLSELLFVDVRNPQQPSLRGRFRPLEGNISGLAVSGNLAYVGHGETLSILDTANPAGPIERAALRAPRIVNIQLDQGYAYLGTQSEGLSVVDVRDPDHPRIVASHMPVCRGDGTQIRFVGVGIAAIVGACNCTKGGCDYVYQWLDVRDPSTPVAIPTTNGFLQVIGAYGYVLDRDTLTVFDLRNPRKPARLRSYALPSSARKFMIGDSTIYIELNELDRRVLVYDARNPAELVLRGSFSFPEGATLRGVNAGFAHLVSSTAYALIDIRDLARPAPAGRYETIGSVRTVQVISSISYLGTSRGFFTVDLNRPDRPVLLGRYEQPEVVGSLVAADRAYLVSGEPGQTVVVDVVNVNNPTHPIRLGRYSTGRQVIGGPVRVKMQLVGQLLYLTIHPIEGPSVIDIIDVGDPVAPVLRGSYKLPLGTYLYDFRVVGNTAYVAAGSQFMIVGLENPAAPVLRGSYTLLPPNEYTIPGVIGDFQIVGRYAYVLATENPVTPEGGLLILDIGNPAQPTVVGRYAFPSRDGRGAFVPRPPESRAASHTRVAGCRKPPLCEVRQATPDSGCDQPDSAGAAQPLLCTDADPGSEDRQRPCISCC